MAGNAEMIIALDKKRMTAMAEKDYRTLNEVIADDLVDTHSSARLDTKASLIGNMEAGSTVYTSVVPSDVKAQDLGDAVVLTGTCRIGVTAGGRPASFGVRFTDVYARRGGTWQMVAWQSTRLPDSHVRRRDASRRLSPAGGSARSVRFICAAATGSGHAEKVCIADLSHRPVVRCSMWP